MKSLYTGELSSSLRLPSYTDSLSMMSLASVHHNLIPPWHFDQVPVVKLKDAQTHDSGI